ncbi:MAG: hypothetical protein U0R19_31885 [Bryobacteraceae bacterium]
MDPAIGQQTTACDRRDVLEGARLPPASRLIDHALLEEVRAEVAKMQRHPTIDEVREALSSIEGNMSDVVMEERGGC